jgi:hypothetical protein
LAVKEKEEFFEDSGIGISNRKKVILIQTS